MARPPPRPRSRRAPALALALASCALAGLPACAPLPAAPSATPAPRPAARYRPADAPRELAPAVARAEAALRTFRERIAARQAAEIATVGLRRGVAALHEEAPALAAAVAAQTGVTVGRTGARPRGRPAAWAGPLAAEVEGRKAADVPASVVDLGDRIGLLRPMAIQAGCLACHGGSERVAPDVKAALEALLPEGGATGLAEGDLAGFFWAEATK